MPRVKSHAVSLLLLLLLAIGHPGCIKEYSYEGGDVPPPAIDTTTLPTIPLPAVDFPLCNACTSAADSYEELKWSFRAGDSFLCGIIDKAIVNEDRNAFTFFGPSACSSDTSMVITVYLESDTLNRDYQGLVIPKVVFYFSKLGFSKFLLTTQPDTPFTLTINSYDHRSKMTTGSFSGYTYKPDGTKLLVHSAKFKVKLI